MELDRRKALGAAAGAVAVAMGATSLTAAAEKEKEADREKPDTRCLVTLQLNGFDPEVFTDEQKAKAFLDRFTPIIAQDLVRAKSQPRTRGCSVSGTVSGGPGGVSGSGTITCTF